MKGMDSNMVNTIRAPMFGFGPSLSETSMGGTMIMLREAWSLDVFWSICEVEESVVTTKIVMWKLWLVKRRFPNSMVGIRWPMPGLAIRAA